MSCADGLDGWTGIDARMGSCSDGLLLGFSDEEDARMKRCSDGGIVGWTGARVGGRSDGWMLRGYMLG